jgi:hypothetical protein
MRLAVLVLVPAVAAADPPTLRAALEVGDSTSLALDGWYPVNDRFRLGVTMSHDARRDLGAGRGLCLDDCTVRFGGLAAEAQVQLWPTLVGRAALDSDRFAPTVVALELGADVHWSSGRWAAMVSPTIRLGVARRDLDDNRDTGSIFAQAGPRLWPTGGVFAIARVAGSLNHLATEPTFGVGGGAWASFGAFTVSARGGAAHLDQRDSLFAEIAFAWSR